MFQAHLLEELQKPSGQAIPPGSWIDESCHVEMNMYQCINSPAPDKYQKNYKYQWI